MESKFKRWCVENNLTSRNISEEVGISMSTVRSYMQGQRVPSRRTALKLEKAYGIDTRELFPLIEDEE